jgi:4-amino-4-deoxy-L-arabinose transferase-like glycosyltransferase
MPWLIIGLAVLLRAWKLGEWSLWEDEETTIYFSQNTAKPFPRFFPVFFLMLRQWFEVTGLSIVAGRVLAAAIGVVGVGVTYEVCRRLASRSAGLWAALLLTLNLGHLFWSQSIRYFGLLLVLQILSLYWFYQGFERRKPWLLLASNAAFGLALWTHFSAVLLLPVFVGYLLLVTCWPLFSGRRGIPVLEPERNLSADSGRYHWSEYAAFFIPLALVMVAFAKSMLDAKAFLSTMASASARNPLHVMITLAAYCGLPTMALAALAPLAATQRRRELVLLACCAWLPVAELAVIAQLNLVNVSWYYAIIVLFGVSALGGVALASLAERSRQKTLATLACLSVAYAMVHLAGYYTAMHGDRPRWRDAALYLREAAPIELNAPANPQVFANVPGVVAFYLGVPPEKTMGSRLVQMLPDEPPSRKPSDDKWYVVEAGHATPEMRTWLDVTCRREAMFVARTGPRDRTITVYHYRASLGDTAQNN